MNYIFETHAHYNDEAFDEDREALIAAMRAEGISPIVEIGACLRTSAEVLELAHRYEDHYCAVGVHPSDIACLEETAGETGDGSLCSASGETGDGSLCSASENARDGLEEAEEGSLYSVSAGIEHLRQMSRDPKCLAIGEIGLDYYWEKDPAVQERQKYWFRRQLALAREEDLPVVIHSRDAAADTMAILKEATALGNHGVVHCYSGSPEQAVEYVKMGWFIGVGGVITFKNGRKLAQAVERIPLERIVLETDAPYLSPEPNRGRRNDSRNLRYVAQRIAELKGITKEEVIRQTAENAKRLYGI